MKNIRLHQILVIGIICLFAFSTITLTANYNESPMLTEQVNEGELPPAEERLPDNPKVVNVKEIGEYGGEIKFAHIGNWYCGLWQASREPLMENEPIFSDNPKPNVVEDVDIGENGKEFIFHLREGMKWSDGVHVTTEDVAFAWEDVMSNEELSPVFPAWLKIDGELGSLEIIDDYTFKISFPKKYGGFPLILHSYGRDFADLLVPKHYYKQFHPEYTSMEELKPLIREEDFEEDNWVDFFDFKLENLRNQELIGKEEDQYGAPTLSPWMAVRKPSTGTMIFERNPYYWKVDQEGNQLPYIDEIRLTKVENEDMITTKIISGEVNLDRINTKLDKMQLYKQQAEENNYKALVMKSEIDTIVDYFPNLTHPDPARREIIQNPKFRKALSYGIDREEVNNTLFYGLGDPGQVGVLPGNKYGKDEYDELYIEYDPERAKQMLEEIGLIDEDGDGWREGPDGEKFNILIEYFEVNGYVTPVTEMVVQYWKDLGIDTQMKLVESTYWNTRQQANETIMSVWHHCHATEDIFPTEPMWEVPMSATNWAPLWYQWYNTDGEEGEEPPQEVKNLYKWYETMLTTTSDEERVEAGRNITKSMAENLWSISGMGHAPSIAIVADNMGNIPDEDQYSLWLTWNAERLFFKE